MSELRDYSHDSDLELMDTKEFKAIQKLMNKDEAKHFLRKTSQDLESLIIANQMHEKEVDAAVKSNSEYQKACRIKKDFEDSKRDRLKITTATTKMASLILFSRKKEDDREKQLAEAEK